MLQWVIRGMVYLGSLLMVYNIYGFIRFARYVRKLKSWSTGSNILNIPIVLLICFLMGYLAIGIFGKPDLLVASILLGGSVFVFAMYKLLSSITQRIVESEHLAAELLAAEESNRAKTSFLATMSHEMRTPLNAVIGLDAIALQDESLSPQTRERLVQIDASAHHLLEIINDVLDMNRIESGELVLREAPFSPSEMLDLVNVLTQNQCREKGIEYRHSVSGEMAQTCLGDAVRLRQVLLIILDNAVKFTPEGGTVSFLTERLPGGDDQCSLRFTIRDTGIGMDADFIPKLFQSFAQEDATSTSRHGGSGLGLAIAKRLVDMMGGEIGVESEKGRGSAFTVSVKLPVVQGEPDAVQAPDDAGEVSLDGMHFLIVEDIDINADLLADLLELEGITSERAENGRIAVDMFAQSPPGHFDAILMDLRMPVMDGLDATRAIRAMDLPHARTIPIFAITANAFEEDVQQSLSAGMNAHLPKPVDTDLLFATLRQLMAKSAPKQEGA